MGFGVRHCQVGNGIAKDSALIWCIQQAGLCGRRERGKRIGSFAPFRGTPGSKAAQPPVLPFGVSQTPSSAALFIHFLRGEVMGSAEVVFEIVVSPDYGIASKPAVEGHLEKIDHFGQVVELVKFLRKADNRDC